MQSKFSMELITASIMIDTSLWLKKIILY